jgi:hypothetical protein
MNRTVKPLLVIPVYNHGTTLAEVVRGALATGNEVLVVDDGSVGPCDSTEMRGKVQPFFRAPDMPLDMDTRS